MKLPGIDYKTPVQSLGRRDVGQVIAVANAEASAIAKWGQAGADLYTVIEKDRREEANSQYIDKISAFKTANATKEWFSQEEIAASGIDYEPDSRERIPAYEVYPRMYEKAMKDVLEETSDIALWGSSRNDWVQNKNDMINQEVANTNIAAANIAHAQIKKNQKDRIDLALDDRNYMKAVGLISTYNGTDDERNSMLMITAKLFDGDAYSTGISTSVNHSELDMMERMVLNGVILDPVTGVERHSVLSNDELWKVRNQIESRRTEFGKERTRRQEEVMQQDVVSLLSDDLTEEIISDQVGTDEISSTQALTLREKLKTGSIRAGASDKATLGFYKQQIRELRWMDVDERRMSDKAEELAGRLRASASGIDIAGFNTGDPTLNGNDYDLLVDDLKKEVELHTTMPEYKNARASIKAFTGLDQFDVDMDSLMDESPAVVKAYIEFSEALDDYVDREGNQAEPMEFVRQTQDRFNPTAYIDEGKNSFTNAYPAYKDPKFSDADGNLNQDMIIADMYDRLNNGQDDNLEYEEVMIAIRRFSPETLLNYRVKALIGIR